MAKEKYGPGFASPGWGRTGMPDKAPNSEIPPKTGPGEPAGVKGPGPPDTSKPDTSKPDTSKPDTNERSESVVREGSEDSCPHCGKSVQVMGGKLRKPGDKTLYNDAMRGKHPRFK